MFRMRGLGSIPMREVWIGGAMLLFSRLGIRMGLSRGGFLGGGELVSGFYYGAEFGLSVGGGVYGVVGEGSETAVGG